MRKTEKLVNGNIEVSIPVRLKYDGHKTVIVQPDKLPDTLEPGQMTSLQKALVQGFQYRDALESGQVHSVSELARKEGQERAFLFRALSLVNLAPDIIGAIVSGMEPPALTLARLRKGIPEDWSEQRKAFGME
ncbi:MAG: hypothetical protein GX173_07270 [Ruminococcaceae bacterium]|nr:hypothetical protein [Oscillospiraceae bacterium]